MILFRLSMASIKLPLASTVNVLMASIDPISLFQQKSYKMIMASLRSLVYEEMF